MNIVFKWIEQQQTVLIIKNHSSSNSTFLGTQALFRAVILPNSIQQCKTKTYSTVIGCLYTEAKRIRPLQNQNIIYHRLAFLKANYQSSTLRGLQLQFVWSLEFS